MAGIDKIYGNYQEAKECLEWIEKEGDKAFKEEFSVCGDNISLKDFMYIRSLDNIDINYDKELPISNFPTLIDRWLFKQPNLPKFMYNRLCSQYRLDNEEMVNRFKNLDIESKDDGLIGNHYTIISRTGSLAHRDYILSPDIEVISEDYYWYCEDTDDWEKSIYPKKKNLYSDKCSGQVIVDKMSLKAVIRKLKKYKFHVGTVLSIQDFGYLGEIRLLITK